MHIITYLLQLQNNVKLYHWITTSYPRHIASDKLYNQLDSLVDKFVEVYIGKYDRPRLNTNDLKFSLVNHSDKTINDYLDSVITFMTTTIFNFIKVDDIDLITIRDDMVAIINQTKYLFTLK